MVANYKKQIATRRTKEEGLNQFAREPMTISQTETELGLSAPSVYTHVQGLLCEAIEWEKLTTV